MKKSVVLSALFAAALLLLGAGCSDDAESEDTTTTADEPAASEETTDETTEETTADTTEDTTAEDPTEAARQYEGTWTGSWTNVTFGSTGSAQLTLTVDTSTAAMVSTFDLGGTVFGGADPEPETFNIPLEPGLVEGTSALFGEYRVTLAEDGVVSLVGSPAIFGADSFELTFALDPATISGSYTVSQDDAPYAEGTFELTKG